jgi:hypothetical protein
MVFGGFGFGFVYIILPIGFPQVTLHFGSLIMFSHSIREDRRES